MRTYTPQSSSTNTACKMRAPHLHKISCVSVQKQTICKMSVHGLTCCSIIDDSHKAKYVHQHTYTIFTEAREGEHTHKHLIYRESAHAHTYKFREGARTHHIFYRRGDNAQNIPMLTYTSQSSTTNTECKMRVPHLLQSLLHFLCSFQILDRKNPENIYWKHILRNYLTRASFGFWEVLSKTSQNPNYLLETD